MSVVVGTLTIDLKANTASFAQSMDKMSQLSARTANDIKRSLEKIAAVGLAMGAALATGTFAAIKGSLDAADAMAKMAQAAGTTVETLSLLNYAAALSGVSTEQLAKGMERLSIASFKAQNGNVQLQRIFDRVGVAAQDSNGRLKDSGILLEEVAVKFAGMRDSAGKTALAMAIFGKGGAALIPMLNQYGAEQERVNDEAHRFGLVLSSSTADVAVKAHDDMDRLQSVMKGLGFSLLSAVLPAFDELLQKLIEISQTADLQGLAKAFGGKVVKSVHLLGDALDFAVQHAHALKVALEALAGLKLAAIAIPIIGDLQKGGIANIGKGLDKLTVGFLGLGRVLPVLEKFFAWIGGIGKSLLSLAGSEGIVETATFAMGEAFSGPVGWIALAVSAIGGLAVAVYKFRDATFTVKGETYELRDIWNAAWIEMKDALAPVGTFFSKLMADIKKVWSETVDWIKQNSLIKAILDDQDAAAAWVKAHAGGVLKFAFAVPSLDATDVAALNRAKAERGMKAFPGGYTTGGNHPEHQDFGPPRPGGAPDTSGLGKPQKDIVGDELRKLDLAIKQQQAYLSVLEATPDKIAAVAAEEKARGIILELSNKLIDEGRLKTGQLIPAAQQAAIRQRVASEESLKALVEYGRGLVEQQHAADLSIQQSRAMAAATLDGDGAVREATIDNALLALSYGKTTEQLKQFVEMEPKLRAMFEERASGEQVAAINRETSGLRDELGQRRLINDAVLRSIDAQRQAALASKLYKLDENIGDPRTSADARSAMLAQRDALIQLAKAENDAADAQAALSLLSPVEQLDRERDSLDHAVEALRALQGGTLSYEQELGIAARQQDEFNKATDETVNLLLREGSMGDGVKAFFLKMQEDAKSAAATIYDVLNETFNKLSGSLTDLITAPDRQKRKEAINQFATMFADIGKNLLDTTIKGQLQSGLGKLGKAFGITLPGNKPDGSSEDAALWVRWRVANPLAGQGVGGDASGIVTSLLGGGGGEESGAATTGGGGILGGLLGALGGLVGLHRPASPAAAQGDTARSAFPTRGGAANELETLASAQPSPSSPQASSTSALQFIPSLLRQSAAGAVLGASLLGAPAQALQPPTAGNETVLPAAQAFLPQTAEATPSSPQPSPSSPVEGASSPTLGGPSTPAPGLSSPTPAMPAATVAPIPNPPDVQPQTYTQITRPQPTLFDKILGAGINLAGNIGGSLLGGMVTGAGASASSSGASGAWAQAAQPGDNTPDGIVTVPVGYAGGGKVFGEGSGTSDSIPAMLSHGEYVIKASSAAKYLPLLHRINSDKITMATGGLVGYDEGGLVPPSMAYMPAERGMGMMSSAADQTASTVQSSTPSSSGDTHTWHIDARGNPDPAQSIAQTARMMKTAAPQIAAAAVHAMKDQQLRRPPSAR